MCFAPFFFFLNSFWWSTFGICGGGFIYFFIYWGGRIDTDTVGDLETNSRATERMNVYKPGEHEEFTSVAPLLQFFELVHIGDMIQSMVQVYFDKELVSVLLLFLLCLHYPRPSIAL